MSHRSRTSIRILPSGWIPVVIISAIVCGPALSDVSDAQRVEVDHLLEFIRTTDCVIERNGKKYKGEDAHAHVRKKYDYFRSDIRTTEEFIEYSATKSTMSGKHYLVTCGDEVPIHTRDWLIEELDTYRRRIDD